LEYLARIQGEGSPQSLRCVDQLHALAKRGRLCYIGFRSVERGSLRHVPR
jgi:hypothetical protein